MLKKPFWPVAVIFLVTAFLFIAIKSFFKNVDDSLIGPLVIGNLILYFTAFYSFRFYQKAISNDNTQVFLRMVYSAMLLKMGVCIAAVLLYAFTIKPVNKIAILIFFGLYFIYTFAEIKIVLRLNKAKKNG